MKRAKTAHHEASHAVIARMQGLACPYVTMFATDAMGAAAATTACATHRARGADQATLLAAIRKDIIVCLAGPCGQARYRWPAQKFPVEWQSDIEDAHTFAIRAALVASGVDLPQKPDGSVTIDLSADQQAYANDLIEQCRDTATDLVKEHWPAIVRVAQRLMVCDLIDQNELDRLIGADVKADAPFVLERRRRQAH
jgi:hypothetical protein